MDIRQFLANVTYAERPNVPIDDPRKVLPPEEIRLKLIAFERLDMEYNFAEMKSQTTSDPDVGAWWVYWVYQTMFVWRFLFAKNIAEEGAWLHQKFKETVGEELYEKKLSNTKDYLKSVGETVEQNI